MWRTISGRGKHDASCADKPHFVAIPEGAYGVDDGAALTIFLAHEGEKDSDTEIKALEHKKADKEECYNDEPECLQIHYL